jgi:hypothetical protein
MTPNAPAINATITLVAGREAWCVWPWTLDGPYGAIIYAIQKHIASRRGHLWLVQERDEFAALDAIAVRGDQVLSLGLGELVELFESGRYDDFYAMIDFTMALLPDAIDHPAAAQSSASHSHVLTANTQHTYSSFGP